MNVLNALPLVLFLANEAKPGGKEKITGEYNPAEQRWHGDMPWQATGTTDDCPSDHDIHETSV